ncbi:MAG: type II CAAX endopeptidase family protein [Cyclobacteriaceae bacterium]
MKLLFIFFGLAYFISWAIWFPLYGHVFGAANLPQLPFHHALGGLGPLLAAVLVTGIYFKKKGLLSLASQCFQIRPILYLVMALFSPFVLAVCAAAMSSLVNNTSINLTALLSSKEFPQFKLISFFIYNVLFFGFGEEVGWRGFALPLLQSKLSALTASIALTAFWALWHLPLFFYRPGYTTMSAAGILGWIFSLLTGSILLTWMYNSSRASILICAVFHATIDIAFTADMVDKSAINYMGFLITIWGILTILIFKPKDLARLERIKNSGGT